MSGAARGHLLAEQGVSGDMLLSVLVDAGAPLAGLQDAVDALDVGEVALRADEVVVDGLRATAVRAVPGPDARRLPRLADLEAALGCAALPEGVADDAAAALRRLAGAEAAVHGAAVDDVVLHELGDVDTIVEVVACCAAVHALGAALSCGPVAVGGGVVEGDHGPLPVPPPAVVELLGGFVVHGGGQRAELTTPTGAALLAALTAPVDGVPPLRLRGQARGASSPPPGRAASTLTLLLGDAAAPHGEGADVAGATSRPAALLEATVDDLSPELVPVVLDRLRAAGAHDAWAVPALMKKGRAGQVLTALGDRGDIDALAAVLFRESTTLGLRVTAVDKRELPRRWVDVDVGGEAVRVKLAELDGEVVTAAAELDDARAAAERLGWPVRRVQEAAAARARRSG